MRPSRRQMLCTSGALAASVSVAACGGKARQALPDSPPDDVLGQLDGVGLAARIRTGEIRAGEVLEAAIARAQRLEPMINSLVTETFDGARAQSRAVPQGPFAGIPTLIKDLTPQRGVRCTYGSRAFAANIAEMQSPYVDAIFGAGFVSIGRSATPEFGLDATTEPLENGPTRNPWDLNFSSGGSSGGAAAAVAAGIVPIAHATDGGGSIRIPASCCGVFGLKPSRGRTTPGADREIDLSVQSCISRSVRDSAGWLAATQIRGGALRPLDFITGPSQRRLRVGLTLPDMLGRAPHADVAGAIENAALLLQGLGHRVEIAMPTPNGERVAQAFSLLWALGAAEEAQAVQMAQPGARLEDLLEPFTLGLAEQARNAPKGAIGAAIEVLIGCKRGYASLFANCDVLLSPVLATPPLPIGTLAPTQPFAKLQAALHEYVAYTPLQNIAGAPAMSVPLGWSKAGLPIGVHFAAQVGEEAMLLALAYELEQAQPWADMRPTLSFSAPAR